MPKLSDPWAKHEAWRYQGPFTRYNRFKGSLPGFGTAVVAFALFNIYEYATADKDPHGSHGHH